jgi:hypothetical protein
MQLHGRIPREGGWDTGVGWSSSIKPKLGSFLGYPSLDEVGQGEARLGKVKWSELSLGKSGWGQVRLGKFVYISPQGAKSSYQDRRIFDLPVNFRRDDVDTDDGVGGKVVVIDPQLVHHRRVARQSPPEVDDRSVVEDERDVTSGGEVVALAEVEGLVDGVSDDFSAVLTLLLARPVALQFDLGP